MKKLLILSIAIMSSGLLYAKFNIDFANQCLENCKKTGATDEACKQQCFGAYISTGGPTVIN